MVYTGFGTIHGFRHPLGALKRMPPSIRGTTIFWHSYTTFWALNLDIN